MAALKIYDGCYKKSNQMFMQRSSNLGDNGHVNQRCNNCFTAHNVERVSVQKSSNDILHLLY